MPPIGRERQSRAPSPKCAEPCSTMRPGRCRPRTTLSADLPTAESRHQRSTLPSRPGATSGRQATPPRRPRRRRAPTHCAHDWIERPRNVFVIDLRGIRRLHPHYCGRVWVIADATRPDANPRILAHIARSHGKKTLAEPSLADRSQMTLGPWRPEALPEEFLLPHRRCHICTFDHRVRRPVTSNEVDRQTCTTISPGPRALHHPPKSAP